MALNTDYPAIEVALREVFPRAAVGVRTDLSGEQVTIVEVNGDHVLLRFRDMPRMAKIFGTEHLDFGSQAGVDVCDSYSFDGVLLTIVARR